MSKDNGRSNATTANKQFMKGSGASHATLKRDRQIRRKFEAQIQAKADDRWLRKLLGR
jgi:hypothetical protein